MPRKTAKDVFGDDAVVAHLTATGRKRREKLREISSAQRPTERRNNLRPELQLIEIPLDQLKPAPQRARKTTRAQVERLKRSIAHFGLVLPILVNGEQEIVVGHAVAQAARELGLATIATIAVDHLSPPKQRALAIAINRSGETGEWDFDELKLTLEALAAEGEDLADTLFDDAELDGILHDDFDDSNGGEEPTEPPRPEAPVTILGDIWDLGPHVVGCGDARDAVYLAQLMGGENAQAAFIDPPYNVKILGNVCGAGRHHREFIMASGEMSRDQFYRFLGESLLAVKSVMAPGAIGYACMDWRHVSVLQAAAERVGFEIINLAVWSKTNAGMGSLYRSAHELILVTKNPGAPHKNRVNLGKSGRYRTNVWNYPGGSSLGSEARAGLDDHSTPKPPEMVRDAIEDVTDRNDIVVDTFLGGGTTLIACARAGRRFRGFDLDAAYVDLALLRWMRESGGQAILRATGETFAMVKMRRARGLPEPDREPKREPEPQTDERLLLSAMPAHFGDRDAGAPS